MNPAGRSPILVRHSTTSSDDAVPVLILKSGRYILHHGAVGIIRSLGNLGVPVYAVVEDRFTPAAVSRYLSGAYVWDTRSLSGDQIVEGLATIHEQLNRPAILIPTDDGGAILIAENAGKLSRWFLFPHLPATLPRTLANKRSLYALCKGMGMPCPTAFFPDSVDSAHEFLKTAAFPIVVKAAAGWLLKAGPTTSIAWTPEEAIAIYRKAECEQGPNAFFQDYIADGEDWFFHGYCNAQSDCLAGFTGRKLRSYPPLAGITTLGQSIANDVLQQQARAFLRAILYAGIVDIDYRLDRRSGQYLLLDCNPRIGAQFRLFEDSARVDVARALYFDLVGQPIRASAQIEGRKFIVEVHDFLAAIWYFRRRRLAIGEWWRSLQGEREFAWFKWRDPIPALIMWTRLVIRVMTKPLRTGLGWRTVTSHFDRVPMRLPRSYPFGLIARADDADSDVAIHEPAVKPSPVSPALRDSE